MAIIRFSFSGPRIVPRGPGQRAWKIVPTSLPISSAASRTEGAACSALKVAMGPDTERPAIRPGAGLPDRRCCAAHTGHPLLVFDSETARSHPSQLPGESSVVGHGVPGVPLQLALTMLCKFIGRKEREDRLAQGGRMGGPAGSERGKRAMMPSRQGLLDLRARCPRRARPGAPPGEVTVTARPSGAEPLRVPGVGSPPSPRA